MGNEKIEHISLETQIKDKADNAITVIASTNSVDREGEILNIEGWQLDNFKKNPVLLWSHMAHQLPIGKVINIWTEGNKLMSKVIFAGHKFAQDVAQLVKDEILKTVSVGFIPKEYDEEGRIKKQELLELSFVNVPANPEAEITLAYKTFQKSLEKEIDYNTKPEETDKYIRIPVNQCDVTATIDISAKEGIKALYCGKEKKIRTYLFLKSKGWDMETAKQWVKDHEKGMGKAFELFEFKEGRIISERNRGVIRVMIDACKQASESGNELLTITEPPKKKGEAISTSVKKHNPTLSALRLIDKQVEVLINQEKKGGVKIEKN